MLKQLKERVLEANLRIVREGLVVLTWGNASAVDREQKLLVIKPSGVSYSKMKRESMVVVSLETGEVIEGELRPSSDTPTHIELYRAFTGIGGIVHTHSLYATTWAQAKREIPVLGTTHGDHFFGAVPCTREMESKEIGSDYEMNTGRLIVERFRKINPLQIPGVLVAGHGPFVWGTTVKMAVENAIVLERVARMASETLRISPATKSLKKALVGKHFLRKHGEKAYYGQKDK